MLNTTTPTLQLAYAIISLLAIKDKLSLENYTKNPLIEIAQLHPAILEELELKKA